MLDCATKTEQEAKQQQNAAEGETQEEEANIIRGNRIGPRFKTNLVEAEEYEIVANPETGIKVHIVILLMRIIIYEMVLILVLLEFTSKIYGNIGLYHHYQQQLSQQNGVSIM